jgi:hypothetical protein
MFPNQVSTMRFNIAVMKSRSFSLRIRLLCTSIFLVAVLTVHAQVATGAGPTGDASWGNRFSNPTTDPEWQPMTSVYLEFGGKLMYSLNIDFRKREQYAWSLGISVMTDESGTPLTYYQTMFFPSVMGYYLTGPKRRIELGGGVCPLIGTEQGLAAIALFGSAG